MNQSKISATYDQELPDGHTLGVRILATDATGKSVLVILANGEARTLVEEIENWI